jgi:hypothetical protein
MSDLSKTSTSELLKSLTDDDLKKIAEEGAIPEPSPMSPVEGASPWEVGSVPTAREMKPFVRGAAQLAVGLPTSIAASPIAGGAAATLAGIGVDAAYGDVGTPGGYAVEGLLNTVLPAGAAKGLDYLGRGAVRSALKIPPTQITREGADKVVDTIVKENMRVGKGGVLKGKSIVRSVESDLDIALKSSQGKVNVDDVVNAIESQKQKFANTDDPQAAYDLLDGIAEKLRNHPNVSNGQIPIDKAQLMKKELYKKLDSFYKNLSQLEPSKAEAGRISSIGFASEAEGLRKSILSDPNIPKEAADWLKREGNVINALRWIKRRANVASNLDPITFNDVLLGGLIREGLPAAIAVRILRTPQVTSQIGIWMARAAPKAAVPLQAGAIGATNLLSQ